MSYTITYRDSVKKDLRGLDASILRRIDTAILSLADNPRPPGCVKIAAQNDLWRIRVGNYRILYEIHNRQLVVLVISVAHRREVYRGL